MIIPKGDRLLIEPIKEETVITMGEEEEDKPTKGKIIGLGDKMDAGEYSIGDVVYFRPFLGHEIKVDGKDLIVLETENVIAKEID